MDHLLIIYQFILMIFAVTVLVLVLIVKSKIDFLKPFFKFYLTFTLLLFFDLYITYFLSNLVVVPGIITFYSYIIPQSALFYLFNYFLLDSIQAFFKVKRKFLKLGIRISLIVSFILVVSPLSLSISGDLKNLNIESPYYISILPYLFTSLYSVILIIQNLRISKIKKEDRFYIIPLSFFSIISFILELFAYYFKIIHPSISTTLETSDRGLIPSYIYLIFLSIFVFIYTIKNITTTNKIPDTNYFLSLGLTPRESEVSILIAKGLNNQEIINQLHISKSTLKTHINSIFKKTNVSGRDDFIKTKCKIT